jgi:hypothetical protein
VLNSAEGKLHMFLAIDRVSKFTYVESFEKAGKMNGAQFLINVVAALPCKIHTVLTDNGIGLRRSAQDRNGPTRTWLGQHIFDRVCIENGITHKPTKPYHPWTNGQAERMNRTIKDATVRVFHYPDLESLKALSSPSSLPTTAQSTSRLCDGKGHLSSLDDRPINLQNRSAAPHSGTKHLGRCRRAAAAADLLSPDRSPMP